MEQRVIAAKTSALTVQFCCVFIIFPSPQMSAYIFFKPNNHFLPTLPLLSLQLIASNPEGKSSPSEVLVCTTNPDKPGPPSAPCVAATTPFGFTVTWGKDLTASESNSQAAYSNAEASAGITAAGLKCQSLLLCVLRFIITKSLMLYECLHVSLFPAAAATC